MRKFLKTSELVSLWEELKMKFIHHIKTIDNYSDNYQIIFKLHQVPKDIRDKMILRRFSSMPGVDVGSYKPRRIKDDSLTSLYTVYITASCKPYFVNVRFKAREFDVEGFDKWVTALRGES